ncbi:MAG: regulatory protein RecX [Cyclonatronaceae bacterium]
MDEQSVSLPGRCTDISVQKKKADRVSLYVENAFLDGFHRDVIENAGIRKGDLITPDLYDRLVGAERQFRLNSQIYRWLAVRNHSCGEIIAKSRAKGYTREEAEKALQPFLEKGYVDDVVFAESFTRDKSERHGWGPAKIRRALAQKGIKKHYIDAALENIFTGRQLNDALEAVAGSVAKRLMRAEPGLKRKKKLVDFLIRRGFPGHIVMEKCDELLKKLENEEL